MNALIDTLRHEANSKLDPKKKSALQVIVSWPSSAAADCAAWLRELLR